MSSSWHLFHQQFCLCHLLASWHLYHLCHLLGRAEHGSHQVQIDAITHHQQKDTRGDTLVIVIIITVIISTVIILTIIIITITIFTIISTNMS